MPRVVRLVLIALTLALVPISSARAGVQASSRAAEPAPKAVCKTVVKTIKGRRTKVRVCSRVTTPPPTATPTPSVPTGNDRCRILECPVPQAGMSMPVPGQRARLAEGGGPALPLKLPPIHLSGPAVPSVAHSTTRRYRLEVP